MGVFNMRDKIKVFLGTSLGKGILAILRNGLIMFYGFVLDALIGLIPGIELNPSFKIYLIAFLKLLDEEFHKTGIVEKGITRF
jgi:hypothetical protein